jgi:hypothetical protein
MILQKTTGFTIDATTGKLASVTIKGVEKKVQQDFYYYHGRGDGAYVFEPEEGNTRRCEHYLVEISKKRSMSKGTWSKKFIKL